MKCTEALQLIDLVLDGEATDEEMSMLRFHLNGCESCRAAMAVSRAISGSLSSLQEPDPPEDLLEAVRGRLASGSYDRSPLKRPHGHQLNWKIAAVLPFAAAALLLFGNLGGRGSAAAIPVADTGESETSSAEVYTPAPVVAYSRPTSVTTF